MWLRFGSVYYCEERNEIPPCFADPSVHPELLFMQTLLVYSNIFEVLIYAFMYGFECVWRYNRFKGCTSKFRCTVFTELTYEIIFGNFDYLQFIVLCHPN